jgi:hypothetical protein
MLAKLGLLVATATFLLATPSEKARLDDLIPKTTWDKTGILKLSEPEQAALRDEIEALLRRYHESLSDGAYVIAPSVSTSMKARAIRAQLRIKEVPLRYASRILVVVRSALFNPLNQNYESVGSLKRDAEMQLNIAGPRYHVYVYSMDDDLRVAQVSHASADAD